MIPTRSGATSTEAVAEALAIDPETVATIRNQLAAEPSVTGSDTQVDAEGLKLEAQWLPDTQQADTQTRQFDVTA